MLLNLSRQCAAVVAAAGCRSMLGCAQQSAPATAARRWTGGARPRSSTPAPAHPHWTTTCAVTSATCASCALPSAPAVRPAAQERCAERAFACCARHCVQRPSTLPACTPPFPAVQLGARTDCATACMQPLPAGLRVPGLRTGALSKDRLGLLGNGGPGRGAGCSSRCQLADCRFRWSAGSPAPGGGQHIHHAAEHTGSNQPAAGQPGGAGR